MKTITVSEGTFLTKDESLADIFTIEDHNQAYHLWQSLGLKNKVLIHIDAHIDFAWFSQDDPLTLLQARNLRELHELIKSVKSWNPSPNPLAIKPGIGNYIYSATKDGIVKKFYWVVPDDFLDTEKKLKTCKKEITRLVNSIPGHRASVVLKDRHIRTEFFDLEIIVCDLAGLPSVADPVLLDIDTDFLLTDYQTQSSPYLLQAEKHLPWIWPKELVEILKNKKIEAELITIAYSIRGYFTPLEFKFLGDELKILLDSVKPDINTIKAMEYRQKAMLRKFNNHLDEAVLCLEEAIKLKPTEACNYYNLALIQYAQGRHQQAKEHYQRAIRFDPSYRSEYNNLGQIYRQRKEYKKMEEEYRKLLILDADNSYAHGGIGEAFFVNKNIKEAKSEFESALALDPKNHRARYLLSEIFIEEKQYEKAALMLKEIIDSEPSYSGAYLALARICIARGNIEGAINNYKKVMRLGFRNQEIFLRLSLLYLKKRNSFKAIKLFIQATGLLIQKLASLLANRLITRG